MITADPQQRVSTLQNIIAVLDRDASAEDRDLLREFAPVVYERMPDVLALRLSPEALAERIRENFRFVARTMPPAFQLYKGLPGIHVVVRNPDEAEAEATGATSEVTIVETHTPDAPFIFESLKNYFQKEGLRVFSAIYPVFTVRRQWERVVWIGGAQEDGSRELLCQFHIERIDARERLRRTEHQVFSVLKAVFLGVEDYPAMIRGVSELGSRLRPRQSGTAGGDTECSTRVPRLAQGRQLRDARAASPPVRARRPAARGSDERAGRVQGSSSAPGRVPGIDGGGGGPAAARGR